MLEQLPTYLQLIRDGQWWDFVDDVAANLVRPLWLRHRETVSKSAGEWIVDEDLWIRRTSIIGQLKHKQETDEARLFNYALRTASETEFFIRKAIGWALRQYSYTAPDAVLAFVRENEDRFPGLTIREALKGLRRQGLA